MPNDAKRTKRLPLVAVLGGSALGDFAALRVGLQQGLGY